MAIRWASDRIGEQGVVAFVTSGSWIDGNVDSGVRACLAEEFSGAYVINLRGNARTSGERREEGIDKPSRGRARLHRLVAFRCRSDGGQMDIGLYRELAA